MASKQKTVFVCSNCGNESAKWSGQCFACGEWNTLEEVTVYKENNKNSLNISQSHLKQ